MAEATATEAANSPGFFMINLEILNFREYLGKLGKKKFPGKKIIVRESERKLWKVRLGFTAYI